MSEDQVVVPVGIEETKQVLVALNDLSLAVIKLVKKHAGVAEVVDTLLQDEELKTALLTAFQGVSKVPAELKEIDLAKGLELAMVEVLLVPKLVEALKA